MTTTQRFSKNCNNFRARAENRANALNFGSSLLDQESDQKGGIGKKQDNSPKTELLMLSPTSPPN